MTASAPERKVTCCHPVQFLSETTDCLHLTIKFQRVRLQSPRNFTPKINFLDLALSSTWLEHELERLPWPFQVHTASRGIEIPVMGHFIELSFPSDYRHGSTTNKRWLRTLILLRIAINVWAPISLLRKILRRLSLKLTIVPTDEVTSRFPNVNHEYSTISFVNWVRQSRRTSYISYGVFNQDCSNTHVRLNLK